MQIGAHVSTAGGVSNAINRALEIGAETFQIFASSPRGWTFRDIPSTEIKSFKDNCIGSKIDSVFIHGSYLVNIGSDALHEKSIGSLTQNLEAASSLGASGVIFHGGSHKGAGLNAVFELAISTLKQVLDASPEDVLLILENSAGMGAHIGSSFADLGRILNAVDHPRMKICLDTQHTFAAGYDISNQKTISSVIAEFDKEIGLSNLVAIHANDSKKPLASGVDRHENIGDGYIGTKGFEVIMNEPAFQDIPFILEVPGLDGKGPDKENIIRLKTIRGDLVSGTKHTK